MEAAATVYYYNNISYHILNNPMTSFPPFIIPNGALLIDDNRHSNNLHNSQ